MPKFQPWPDYIIKRCIFLSFALLAAALLLLVWSSARPETFLVLRRYSNYFQNSSVAVLAAGLIGGVLLEDILRNS